MSEEIGVEKLLELSPEELADQLMSSLTAVEQMKRNQEGLVGENNQLRNQLQAATSGKSIYGKMIAIKKDLGYVGKDQKNTGQGWMFRGIDDMLNTFKPLLDKHEVGISTKVLQNAEDYKLNEKTGKYTKNTRLIMEYSFFAADGSAIVYQMPAEGVDHGDKGTNKALSAALKYTFIQGFTVPTKDMEEADTENLSNDIGLKSSKATARKTVTSIASEETVVPVAVAQAKKSFRRKKVATKGAVNVDESNGTLEL